MLFTYIIYCVKIYYTIRPSQILHEIVDVCDYVQAGGTVPDAVTDFSASGNQLAHLSDGDLIEDYAPEMLEPDPATVAVGTAEELEMVFRALGRIHGVDVPRYYVGYVIGHEGMHLAVASTLFQDTDYRMTVLDFKPRETCLVRPSIAFARQWGELQNWR